MLSPDPALPASTNPDVVATASDYASLVAGLAARRRELGLPQIVVDEIAGLAAGYTGKIECGDRGLGRMSLEALLGALGIELVLTRTTPHHLRQRRVYGASCGPIRQGPAPTIPDGRVA